MQDITELQRRLTGALDRIGTGLEGLGPATEPAAGIDGPDPEDHARLVADLESERELTSQLQERLRATKERQETHAAEIEGELAAAREALAGVEADRNRLRAAADALRETCERLREVNARGVADAHLVNNAMTTELDALRTIRESDRAELDAIVRLLADATDTREAPQDG